MSPNVLKLFCLVYLALMIGHSAFADPIFVTTTHATACDIDFQSNFDAQMPLAFKTKVIKILKMSGRELLERIGLYESFKKNLVALVARPNVCSITVAGQQYPVIKYLGSGLSGDAYIIDFKHQPVVAKVSRGSEASRESLLKSIPVHRYLDQVLKLSSPHLIAYDTKGDWELSELIAGEPLGKFLTSGNAVTAHTYSSIRRIFELAAEFKKMTNLTLDLAPDNILIVGEEAYLVDLGPLESSVNSPNFEITINHWIKKYTRHKSCEVLLN